MSKLRKLSDGTVFLPRRNAALEAYMTKNFKKVGERRWEVPEGFQCPPESDLLGQSLENMPTPRDLSPEEAFTTSAPIPQKPKFVKPTKKPVRKESK